MKKKLKQEPKLTICRCHFNGQRIMMPNSSHGLRNWYRRWRALQTPDLLKKFEKYIPENNTGIPIDSAIVQLWQVVHPEAALRKKSEFKGIEKLPIEPFDAVQADKDARERFRVRNLPTTKRERITLCKKPEGEL